MSYEDLQKTGGWIFVIDTENYAGNFEREMTAYITGQIGECGVGDDYLSLYRMETGDIKHEKFDELVEHRPDDHGCSRPCTIYPTPGWFNHGHGGHFREGDESAALKDYRKEVKEYCGKEAMRGPLEAKKALEKGEKYSNWTMKDVERVIKENEKEIAKAMELKKVHKYPAYLSVAIFFYKKPSPEIVELMKTRAKMFVAASKKLDKGEKFKFRTKIVKITGFRLIKEDIITTEEKV